MAPTPEKKKKGGLFSRNKKETRAPVHIDKASIKPVTVPTSTFLSQAHQTAYASLASPATTPSVASAGLSAWPTSPQAPSPSDSQGNIPSFDRTNSSVAQVPWNDVSARLSSGQEHRRSLTPSGSSSPVHTHHKSFSALDLKSTSMTSSKSAQSSQSSQSGVVVAANGYIKEEAAESEAVDEKKGGIGRLFGKRKTMPPPARAVSSSEFVASDRKSIDGSVGGQRSVSGGRFTQSTDNLSSYGPSSLKSPTPSIAPSKLQSIPDTPTQTSFNAQHAERPAQPTRQGSYISTAASIAPSNKSTKSAKSRKHMSTDGFSTVSNGTSSASFVRSLREVPTSTSQGALATIPAGKAVSVSAPIRLRVFIDHPTTDPLYITANPGTETLRSLKHKILKTDNDRFVQFRQQRRPPVEQRWDITESPNDEPSKTTFDIDNRVTLFSGSVDWLTVSQTKRSFEKTRTFKSIVSSQPTAPILAPPTNLLDLVSLFPDTKEAAAARLKGVIEVLVRVAPEGTVPVLVSFSDLPDQPVIIDIGDEMTIGKVKAKIGEARKLVYRSISGGSTRLDPADFYLFKASHPRFSDSPLPFDIDHFEGLAPGMLFDDEEEKFGNHPFIIESGLSDPKVWMKRIELVAFLVSDMEEEFRDSLQMKNVSHEIYTSNPSQYDLSVANLTRHPNSSDSTLTSSSQKDSNSSSNHQRSRTISHGPSQSRSREQESARSRITSQPTRAGPSSRADSRPSTQTSPRKADVRSVSSPVPKTMDLHAPLADFPSTSPGGRVLSYEREQGSSTSKRDKHASIQPPSRQATSPYESSMAGSASVPNLNQILLSKGEKSPRAPFINPANAYSPHELSPSSSPRRDPISLASPAEEDYESTPGSTPGEDEEFVLAPSFEGKTPATERPPIIASSSVSPPRMTRELSGEGSLGMDEILRGFHGEPNGSLGLTNEVGRKLSESENGRAAVFLDQDETAQVQNVIERAQVAEPVATPRYRPSSPRPISPVLAPISDVPRGTYSGPFQNFQHTDDVSPTSQPVSLPPVEPEVVDPRESVASAYSTASYDSSVHAKQVEKSRLNSHGSDHTVQNVTEQTLHPDERESDFVDVEEDNDEDVRRRSDSSSLRAESLASPPPTAPLSIKTAPPSAQVGADPQPRSTRFASTVDENHNQRISQPPPRRPSQRQHAAGSSNRRSWYYKGTANTGYPIRSALKGSRNQAPRNNDPLPSPGESTPGSIRASFARPPSVHSVNTKVGNRISRDMSNFGGRPSMRHQSSNGSLQQRNRLSHLSIYQGKTSPAPRSPHSSLQQSFPLSPPNSASLVNNVQDSERMRQPSSDSRSLRDSQDSSLWRSIPQQQRGSSSSAARHSGDYPPRSPVLSPPSSDSDSHRRRKESQQRALAEVDEASNATEGYTLIGGAMFKVVLTPMDAKGEKVMQTEKFKKSGPLYSIHSMDGSFSS